MRHPTIQIHLLRHATIQIHLLRHATIQNEACHYSNTPVEACHYSKAPEQKGQCNSYKASRTCPQGSRSRWWRPRHRRTCQRGSWCMYPRSSALSIPSTCRRHSLCIPQTQKAVCTYQRHRLCSCLQVQCTLHCIEMLDKKKSQTYRISPP